MGAGLQWEESLGCGRVRREGVVGGKGRVGNGRRKDTGSHGELWPDPRKTVRGTQIGVRLTVRNP